jgi:choline-sulfatase
LSLRHFAGAAFAVVAICATSACQRGAQPASGGAARSPVPHLLLVTLDTTRADAIGPGSRGLATPAFDALAARGRRFTQAYATVPETLPSHASMMTGLYPAGHGVHENARALAGSHAVAAERLRQAGYRTAAFVSSFVLARRFGLARGFDIYDDELPEGREERSSAATTERAIAYLSRTAEAPVFVWVHYFDPHAPYQPAAEFRGSDPRRSYYGEVAAMDRELGRLVDAFERHARSHGRDAAVLVAGDHGEGLGDHGEPQHGNLLYQSTMHVPLLVVGPGVSAALDDRPVSTRRIFHTILDYANLDAAQSLRGTHSEIVLGEAMKPFLGYGWQPQIMAVEGSRKAIAAGKTEIYDLAQDPAELRNLGAGAGLPAGMRQALDDYPVPTPGASRPAEALSEEARRSLASLGYVGATATPAVRKDAPRPADMVHTFDLLEKASSLFVQEQYARAIPLLKEILAADPHNLDAVLRLATSYSMLGNDRQALDAFRRATQLAPRSLDVKLYIALHYARGREWARAVPELESIIQQDPARVPALEALATLDERRGRPDRAIILRNRLHALRTPSVAELLKHGELAMRSQDTAIAIDAFEAARAAQGAAFTHDLQLGVLYLAARRFEDARSALDRVSPSHPEYPMALFKRAQVSVLLNEPDRAARIEAARRGADATTQGLIEMERLFRDPGSGTRDPNP